MSRKELDKLDLQKAVLVNRTNFILVLRFRNTVYVPPKTALNLSELFFRCNHSIVFHPIRKRFEIWKFEDQVSAKQFLDQLYLELCRAMVKFHVASPAELVVGE